jgi:hypothetical protein
MAILAIVWRLHDKGANLTWAGELWIFLPAGIIASAVVYAGFLHLKASRQSISAPASVLVPPRHQAVPAVGITLRETVVEPYDNAPGRHYPRKLRLYCSNDGDDTHLGTGNWIPEQVGLQINRPPACQYELKDHLGRFSGEAPTKYIPHGKWFRLHVGIDSSVSDKDLDQMKKDRSFGILQIPAEVNGLR